MPKRSNPHPEVEHSRNNLQGGRTLPGTQVIRNSCASVSQRCFTLASDCFTEYIKDTAPALAIFLHGGTVTFFHQAAQQAPADTFSLPQGDCECVAPIFQIGRQSLSVAPVYLRFGGNFKCDGAFEGLRAITRDSLIMCGDFNVHHPCWE